jgi:hypothetical protein
MPGGRQNQRHANVTSHQDSPTGPPHQETKPPAAVPPGQASDGSASPSKALTSAGPLPPPGAARRKPISTADAAELFGAYGVVALTTGLDNDFDHGFEAGAVPPPKRRARLGFDVRRLLLRSRRPIGPGLRVQRRAGRQHRRAVRL